MTIRITADDALNPEGNHRAACAELCKRMDARNVKLYGPGASQWTKPMVAGTLPSGEMVHVFLPKPGALEAVVQALELTLATLARVKPPKPYDSTHGTRDVAAAALRLAQA